MTGCGGGFALPGSGGTTYNITVTGTSGEDRSDYTRDESRSIRARSTRLLRSLLLPLRARLIVAFVLVVLSTAGQVAGPALIVAHRPSTVALADRVALLENGRITAVGRHSDLIADNEHYRFVISSLDEDNEVEGVDA